MPVLTTRDTARLPDADYARAEQLLGHHRARHVPAARITPQWLPEGARFRYQVGSGHLVLDPAEGTCREAFDHDRLAAALSTASGHAVESAHLLLTHVEFDEHDPLRFTAFDIRWEWSDEVEAVRKVGGCGLQGRRTAPHPVASCGARSLVGR